MINRLKSYLMRKPLPLPLVDAPKPTPKRPKLRFRQIAEPNLFERAEATFKPYSPPPGVRGENALAMDSLPGLQSWIGQNCSVMGAFVEDGLNFKGYGALGAMMLRAEFRKPVETIAKEATREWIKIKSKTLKPGENEPEEIAALIDELETEMERLRVRSVVRRQITHGLAFGLGHIWVHVNNEALDTETQSMPLTIGPNGVRKGTVDRLVNIDPIWTNPNSYNADNPLKLDYFKPTTWWVQGVEVHASRLFTTVPFEVPDILKPAFNFGGLSLTQMLQAYVHNLLRTRQSVSGLVSNFGTRVLARNMAGNMQTEAGLDYGDIDADGVTGRLQAMTAWQSNNGTFVIDKESEEYQVAQVSLSGLSELQAQSLEFQASIPGIPFVKAFGNQPTGLGASSEGEIRVFYDEISAYQEAHVKPSLDPIFQLAQLNLWGRIDDRLTYEFVPLWQLSEKEAAEVEKIKADIDALNVQEGKITPDEAREREASDPHSFYAGINLSGEAPGLPDTGEFDPSQSQPNPKSLMEGEE